VDGCLRICRHNRDVATDLSAKLRSGNDKAVNEALCEMVGRTFGRAFFDEKSPRKIHD
jgi:hypothetical protein